MLAPPESESKGCSCRTGRYEGDGLGSLSLALSLVAVSANLLGLWILGLPATPATNELVHPWQRSEVLLLLVPRGSTAGVLTAIGSAGAPSRPGFAVRRWPKKTWKGVAISSHLGMMSESCGEVYSQLLSLLLSGLVVLRVYESSGDKFPVSAGTLLCLHRNSA